MHMTALTTTQYALPSTSLWPGDQQQAGRLTQLGSSSAGGQWDSAPSDVSTPDLSAATIHTTYSMVHDRNATLASIHSNLIKQVRSVVNSAGVSTSKYDHIMPLLTQLHWYPSGSSLSWLSWSTDAYTRRLCHTQ